jgi:MFS family permease
MPRAALAPLRLRPLRRLIGAYSINAFGDWMGEIALSLLVLHMTGSVIAVTAVWVLGRFVPALLAPLVLERLGRAPARLMLPSLYAVEAALFSIQAVAAGASAGLTIVLAIAFADGIIALSARSLTRAAVVVDACPAGLLRESNALLGTAFMATLALGPVAGGAIVGLAGVPAALALDALSFAIAALAVGPGARLSIRDGSDKESSVPTRLGGLRETFAHLRHCPRVRTLVVADGVGGVFLALIIPVEVVFVTQTLGGTEAEFGLVLAAWGGGAVVGSSILALFARTGIVSALLAGALLMVVSYLGMGASSAVAAVIAWSVLGGVGNGLQGVLLTTYVQERTPDALQIPVNGALESLHSATPGLGFLLGGLIAETASPRVVYVAAGLGALAVTLAAVIALLLLERGDSAGQARVLAPQ